MTRLDRATVEVDRDWPPLTGTVRAVPAISDAIGQLDINTDLGGTSMTATIDETVFNGENIFGKGEANTAFAQYFTGESFLRALVTDPECAVSVHNVTFEPGCRNNWHIHHAASGGGQVLICTAGSGWYQEEGHDAVSLEPGNVIFTRAGIKHWHGAKADSWFSHIALGVPGENTSNEWLQPVDDAHYDALGGSRP